MKKIIIALLFAVLYTCGAVAAVEVAGVKFEDQASVGGQSLVLNGAGVRSRFVIKVYAAGLYLPQKASAAAGVVSSKFVRRLQIVMLRDVPADQFADALKEGMEANSTEAEIGAIKSEVEQLLVMLREQKEAKSGQTIHLDFLADGKTSIAINGASKGSIGSESLQRALLKIWLGEKPIQNDLKRALLGG